MKKRLNENPVETLAWQGLTIPVQHEWRPLRIEGDYKQGSITIGDLVGPVFKLSWLRPPPGYNGQMWIEKRRRSTAGKLQSDAPPHPPSFEHVSWIENLKIREQSEKTVWWGCAKKSEVLAEVLLTNLREPEINRWFLSHSLPKLEVIPATRPCPWKIYSAQCRIPAGYILNRHRLATGDIVLEFVHGTSSRLMVRQVFPASLALNRRSFSAWMEDRPFTEHYRFRQESEQRDGNIRIKRTGRKVLPWPLGWVRPKRYVAEGVQEQTLDRLLLVESEWRDGGPGPPVDDVMSSMRETF